MRIIYKPPPLHYCPEDDLGDPYLHDIGTIAQCSCGEYWYITADVAMSKFKWNHIENIESMREFLAERGVNFDDL